MKRILLLYTFEFSGHHKACLALASAFRSADPGLEIRVENFLDLSHPHSGRWIQSAYFAWIGALPALWGAVYDRAFGRLGGRVARRLASSGGARLERLIDDCDPDVILCTQAIPCIAVSELKKKRAWVRRTLYGVMTDYHPHLFWAEATEAEFVVPGEYARGVLESLGVDSGRIRAVGIPIDAVFAAERGEGARAAALAVLELDPELPHIAVMGGSRGLVAAERVLDAIERSGRACQVTIFTGQNRALFRKLSRRVRFAACRVRVLPYVSSVEPYLTAADVLVTKAGGLSVAEAMARGVPVVLTGNLPGQEQNNARLLCDGSAVSAARDAEDAGRKALELAFRAKAPLAGKFCTSADIARDLMGSL